VNLQSCWHDCPPSYDDRVGFKGLEGLGSSAGANGDHIDSPNHVSEANAVYEDPTSNEGANVVYIEIFAFLLVLQSPHSRGYRGFRK